MRAHFSQRSRARMRGTALADSSRMLRATREIDARLRIEGQLTDEAVDAIENALTDAPCTAVDVSGVTFADARGTELLRSLEARGIAVRGASAFLRMLMRREV
jgi:hypothetical protein